MPCFNPVRTRQPALLHLGAAYSLRFPGTAVRFRERPEAHLAGRFVDTRNFRAARIHLLGFEGAMLRSALFVQSEFIQARAQSSEAADPTLNSFYIQAGYVLTGEHRNYRTSAGTFEGVEPKRSVLTGSGPGAWEALLRYSVLDFNDRLIAGGKLTDFSAGLNWYLDRHARVLFNYIRGDLSHTGIAHVFQVRLQLAF